MNDTLTAELLVTPTRIAQRESFAVALRITNHGASAVLIPVGDPSSFVATLRDTAGTAIEPSQQRLDLLSDVRWIRVAPGATHEIGVTAPPQSGIQLDTLASLWTLAPGRYQLGGRFTVGADAPPDAWRGTLELAPVALEVA